VPDRIDDPQLSFLNQAHNTDAITSGTGMASKRRFAIVSPNFHPRICGIGDHSARLGEELRRRGEDVAVFSRKPAEPNPETPDLEVHGVEGSLSLTIAEGVRRAVADWAPTDVILQYTSQIWNSWRFGSLAQLWLTVLARTTGVRVTLIAHELFVPWRPRPDLLVATLLQRVQFAAVLKSCHRLFVTTESRARYIEPACRLLGLPAPEILRVGANAIPVRSTGLFSRGDSDAPRLGVFSTAAVGKRFDVVLDAFTAIAQQYPRAELVLIGDLGPSEAVRVRSIEDTARRHPAASKIRITGRLSLMEIAKEVAALDVYMFPMETGANTRSGTLPVALGSGLPVVAVRGIETDASLFSGENLVFSDALTGPAFASATLGLLRDRPRMRRVGDGARHLYDGHLSWSRIADQVIGTG
jgi:glycosyltransferase involved in cell wall biosynthesis